MFVRLGVLQLCLSDLRQGPETSARQVHTERRALPYLQRCAVVPIVKTNSGRNCVDDICTSRAACRQKSWKQRGEPW